MVLRIFPIPSTYPLPPSPSLPLSLSLPSLRIFLHRWKPCIDRCNWPLLHRAVSDAYPGWMDSLNMKTTLFIRWQGDNNKNGGDINHRVCTVYVHWTAPVHHCRIELRSHRAPGIYQTQTRFDQRSQSCLYRARKPIAGKMSWSHNRIPIRFDYDWFQAVPRDKAPSLSSQNYTF